MGNLHGARKKRMVSVTEVEVEQEDGTWTVFWSKEEVEKLSRNA